MFVLVFVLFLPVAVKVKIMLLLLSFLSSGNVVTFTEGGIGEIICDDVECDSGTGIFLVSFFEFLFLL